MSSTRRAATNIHSCFVCVFVCVCLFVCVCVCLCVSDTYEVRMVMRGQRTRKDAGPEGACGIAGTLMMHAAAATLLPARLSYAALAAPAER